MPCLSCYCINCQKYYTKKALKQNNQKYCPICQNIRSINDFSFKYPNTTDKRRRHICIKCSYKYNSYLYKRKNSNN